MCELGFASSGIWRTEGLKFLSSSNWDPGAGAFGAGAILALNVIVRALAQRRR